MGVAKIRAARLIFDAVARHLGVKGAPPARIEARSSARMLSGLDVNVNMLRLTAAAFAGGVGGADAVALDTYDAPLGAGSALGRRQARNIQLVLMQEGAVAATRDPAGGAFYLERLGLELAERGWARMQALERAGGLLQALADGSLAQEVQGERRRLLGAVARRRIGLVGVSEFPNLQDPPPPLGPDQDGPFAPLRLSAPFEALRRKAAALEAPPRAYLVLLGTPKDHGPRAAFAAAALAAGGVATDQGPLETFKGGPAVLCGGEEDYAVGAEGAVALLKARGAPLVLLAGRDPQGVLAALGVDGLVHAGMDHVEVLDALLNAMAHGAHG
jgi:methylmalonyl-CoA mutase